MVQSKSTLSGILFSVLHLSSNNFLSPTESITQYIKQQTMFWNLLPTWTGKYDSVRWAGRHTHTHTQAHARSHIFIHIQTHIHRAPCRLSLITAVELSKPLWWCDGLLASQLLRWKMWGDPSKGPVQSNTIHTNPSNPLLTVSTVSEAKVQSSGGIFFTA